jgi:hypothetical protein
MEGRDQGPALYRHTQQGYLTGLGLALATVTQIGSLARAMRAPKPRLWLRVTGIVLTGGLAYLMSSLTVEITDQDLAVGFRRGFLRRTIGLGDIRSVEEVSLPWYYGWGVRLTPKGWLYNVQGLHAVRLEFADGGKLTIGTDEPERLRVAVETMKAVC